MRLLRFSAIVLLFGAPIVPPAFPSQVTGHEAAFAVQAFAPQAVHFRMAAPPIVGLLIHLLTDDPSFAMAGMAASIHSLPPPPVKAHLFLHRRLGLEQTLSPYDQIRLAYFRFMARRREGHLFVLKPTERQGRAIQRAYWTSPSIAWRMDPHFQLTPLSPDLFAIVIPPDYYGKKAEEFLFQVQYFGVDRKSWETGTYPTVPNSMGSRHAMIDFTKVDAYDHAAALQTLTHVGYAEAVLGLCWDLMHHFHRNAPWNRIRAQHPIVGHSREELRTAIGDGGMYFLIEMMRSIAPDLFHHLHHLHAYARPLRPAPVPADWYLNSKLLRADV